MEDRWPTAVATPSPSLPYDRHVGRYSAALATEFVRAVGAGRGGRALDVGCGTGALTRALAARLGPERVAAVDPSSACVAACAGAVPAVDVRLGRVERLPFGDGEFDAVLAQLVIDKVDGPAALREMRRVARPGALVAASVWDFGAGMTLLRAYWDAALAVDPEGARAAGGHVRPVYSRPGELAGLWTEADLDAVTVGQIVVRAGYDDVDDAWWPFTRGVGSSGAHCTSLDACARSSLKAEFARRLGSPRGPFALTARAWYVRGSVPSGGTSVQPRSPRRNT